MLLSNLFTIRRPFLFDANSGGGEGGGTSTGEGGQPGASGGTGTANNSGGSADNSGGTANNSGGNGATFSQADLDRIAGNTRKEAMAKFAKEHGFADVKALEAAIKSQREADEAAKTELQKAKDGEVREKSRAETAEARLYDTLLRAAFDRAAVEQVADLELAYLAAKEAGLLKSESGVTVDVESGKVSGLDKVVEKLLKDKPILKKAQTAAPGGTGGSAGGTTAPAKMTPEQEQQYRMRYGIRGS